MTPTEQDRQAAESAMALGVSDAGMLSRTATAEDRDSMYVTAIEMAIAQARQEGVVAGIDKAIITISELKEPTK